MRFNWRRVSLVLAAFAVLVVLIVPVASALAAEPVSFKDVKLWLYPEYDDPRLLVMVEGKIVGAQPPAQARFLVPNPAEMYSAGSMDAQGKYTGGPPNRNASGTAGWDEISYEVKTDTFRVEYYDPVIKISEPDKNISFEFRVLYPVSNLSVLVQEPRASSNFSTEPKEDSKTTADGFPARVYTFTNVTPDKPLRIQINYTKTDPQPSVPPSNTGPTGNTGGAGGTETMNPLTLAGIMLGVITLAVGIYWAVKPSRNRRPAQAPVRAAPGPTRTPRGARPAGPSGGQPAGAKFCSQCGNKLERPSRFCPKCGAEI